MNDLQRSLIILAGSFLALVLVTIGLASMVTGPTQVGDQPDTGRSPTQPSAPASTAVSGIGGALSVTGDRIDTFVLDRSVIGDDYVLVGDEGRIFFDGRPASVVRMQFNGLSFFLDPGECTATPGERDAETGLAPVDVSCVEISDVRDTAVVTVEGTLRVAAEQVGLRGDLPETGGEVAVGAETLTFEAATLDLQQPEVILDSNTGFTTRNPRWYPVTLDGAGGTLRFEYDRDSSELTLMGVELAGGLTGGPETTCEPSFRELGELSPQVTVAEMTVDCPAVAFEGTGSMPLTGTLTVDVIADPG